MSNKIDVTIIGGGMFTTDVLLPSVYQLQRMGIVNNVAVCALSCRVVLELRDNKEINEAFPGFSYTPYPSYCEPPDAVYP